MHGGIGEAVNTPDCGSGTRGFDPHISPHNVYYTKSVIIDWNIFLKLRVMVSKKLFLIKRVLVTLFLYLSECKYVSMVVETLECPIKWDITIAISFLAHKNI